VSHSYPDGRNAILRLLGSRGAEGQRAQLRWARRREAPDLFGGKRRTCLAESAKQDWRKAPYKSGGKRQTCREYHRAQQRAGVREHVSGGWLPGGIVLDPRCGDEAAGEGRGHVVLAQAAGHAEGRSDGTAAGRDSGVNGCLPPRPIRGIRGAVFARGALFALRWLPTPLPWVPSTIRRI
jgi:hypothetical protein